MKEHKICELNDIQKLGSKVIKFEDKEVALFRTSDDQFFAVENKCPHKEGKLSEGIVTGCKVICPLHSLKIDLIDGKAVEPDEGCVDIFEVTEKDGYIWIKV